MAYAHWSAAVLYAGIGRYEDALAAAGQASEHPDEMGVSTWARSSNYRNRDPDRRISGARPTPSQRLTDMSTR